MIAPPIILTILKIKPPKTIAPTSSQNSINHLTKNTLNNNFNKVANAAFFYTWSF